MASSDRRPAALHVALAGAGRVGTAVALLLQKKGHEIVGVSSRSETSRARAARRLRAPTFDLGAPVPPSEVVLVGTGDTAIEEVATALAAHIDGGTYVCHFAGSLGIAPLAAVAEVGANPCALHPVQACPDVDTAVTRLPGSAWGVTCPDEVRSWVGSFVAQELGGIPFWVDESDRPVWHAASVTVSNGIAALLATGESILQAIGVADPVGVLGPLAAGTVANAREGGGGGRTLTGPVVRAETAVVERHLKELRRRDPVLASGYASVAATIVRAALDAQRIDEKVAQQMLTRLGAS